MNRRWTDRGAATIEMVVMLPGAVAMVIVIMFAGRLALARQVADSAAYDAARSASLARTESAAITQATAAARASFLAQGFRCDSLTVHPNTAGFRVAVGQPATVSVRVVCRVDLRDILEMPGFPVTDFITLESTFVSPLDTYRSRT